MILICCIVVFINIFRLIKTIENWIKMSERELTEGNVITNF